MTEINSAKNNQQQSLPHLKQLPILQLVQNLHSHNLKVAKICRQHSLNLLKNYQQNKMQYQKHKEPRINVKLKTVVEMTEHKKKTIEIKQKDMKKKNNQNIAKLEHILDQKRMQLEKKQAKMMQQSQVRRIQFLKQLTNSHYVSRDKRYHIKQRQSKELQKSLMLQKENNEKVQAAIDRREIFLSQLKQGFKRRNEQTGTVLWQCLQQQEFRKSGLLKKMVQKEQIIRKSLQEKANEADKRLEQKKKQGQKKKQKHMKKRSQILEAKQSQIQKYYQQVSARIYKANVTREVSLKSLTNDKLIKRKLRQKQQFYASIYKAKQEQEKTAELTQKLYSSQQSFYNAKELKQKIHSRNLYEYCRMSHQLWRDRK